jgi:hypothetical protein
MLRLLRPKTVTPPPTCGVKLITDAGAAHIVMGNLWSVQSNPPPSWSQGIIRFEGSDEKFQRMSIGVALVPKKL